MDNKSCPLCGSTQCQYEHDAGYTHFKCNTYETTVGVVHSLLSNLLFSDDFIHRMFNIICEKISATPIAPNNQYWHFYYDK